MKFLRRKWWDRERAREIASYLEIETAENIERGMTPDEAAAAAHRKFGNIAMIREDIYRMNSIGWLESVWLDLRYGARQLRLSPGFAAVAIGSLALGIGANTAIFELLDAVRLRSLPIPNPQELAEVKIIGGNRGMGVVDSPYAQLTRPLLRELRARQQGFSDLFGWDTSEAFVGVGTDIAPANELRVTGNFFSALGIQPFRGRLLRPEDESACPSTRAVVSYAYAQTHTAGTVTIDGEPKRIVGVTPPGFTGLAVGESFDVAQPYCQEPAERRDVFDVAAMGRLKPGWTVERASAQVAALSRGVFEATALTGYSTRAIEDYKRLRLAAYPASAGVSALRETYDSSLWLLLGITGLVLTIACANIANLLLARAGARAREISIRLALGASRPRLARQLLAESALLAAVGALLGIALARVLSGILIGLLSTETSKVNLQVSTDWRVLLFTIALTALTCVLFGAAPALRTAIVAGARGTTQGRDRFLLQRSLVSAQVAVSLVLLSGALLFVRSFHNLLTFDPGMREAGITVGFFALTQPGLQPAAFPAIEREILSEIRATPGILSAASTTTAPLMGSAWSHGVHVGTLEGASRFTWVSPGYFQTMGIPILSGRDFRLADTAGSTRVAVVNRTFVRTYLAGVNPIGQRLRTSPEPGYPETIYQIVGVIPDTRYSNLRDPTPPMTFAPETQFPAPGPGFAMMIRSNMPSAQVNSAIRASVGGRRSGLLMQFVDFERSIRDGMVRERMLATLSGFFGALAAVLAAIGLYGVISYAVARRRNEIGIRIALGAPRAQVIKMILREACALLLIGIASGTGLVLAAGRSAGALLFELKPNDPLTIAAAAALLALIAVTAVFIPARRASKLDPLTAIRYE